MGEVVWVSQQDLIGKWIRDLRPTGPRRRPARCVEQVATKSEPGQSDAVAVGYVMSWDRKNGEVGEANEG